MHCDKHAASLSNFALIELVNHIESHYGPIQSIVGDARLQVEVGILWNVFELETYLIGKDKVDQAYLLRDETLTCDSMTRELLYLIRIFAKLS